MNYAIDLIGLGLEIVLFAFLSTESGSYCMVGLDGQRGHAGISWADFQAGMLC